MKIILTFVVLFFTLQSVFCVPSPKKFEAELIPDSKNYHKACVQVTGVTNEMIQEVVDGKFNDENPITMKYATCLWRFSNLMNEDGDLDLRRLAENFPDGSKEVVEVYNECNKESFRGGVKEMFIKVWNMEQCLYRKLNDQGLFVFS